VRHGSTRKAPRLPFIPGADRVREFRARAKRNVMLVTIEVPKDLPDALVDAGYLQEWNCENPQEIRRAIELILAQLMA
jgi:hypothetical protein